MEEKKLYEYLRKKGWKDSDIEKTINVIRSKKNLDKSGTKPHFDRFVYWIALFIAIIGNFLISITLIPFLMVLSSIQLYFIIGVIALAFGFLFNLLITDIDNLDTQHHIIAGIFIPAIAIINVFVMTKVANLMEVALELKNVEHDPLVVSSVYVLFFILPYVFFRLSGIKV